MDGRRASAIAETSNSTPKNSFELLPDLRRRMVRVRPRSIAWLRFVFRLRALWRHIRVTKLATRLLGPQYRRSRELIEIDITYLCNLHCLNCNRSVTQARDTMHMPVEMVTRFVDESIAAEKRWRRIRVLGGEPTLHPQFQAVVGELLRFKRWYAACIVEVVTNGYGARVKQAIEALPTDVMVDNSAKESPLQPAFGPFNLAPIDDPRYAFTDYVNGCAIARDCGMGLTPMGYYPCAVAGGIDRITQERLGQPSLPDDSDDMQQALRRLCSLCGRFRDGHMVPRKLRPRLTEAKISPTWRRLYEEWHAARAASSSQLTAPPSETTRVPAGVVGALPDDPATATRSD